MNPWNGDGMRWLGAAASYVTMRAAVARATPIERAEAREKIRVVLLALGASEVSSHVMAELLAGDPL